MHLLGALLLFSLISSCGKSHSNAGLPYQKESVLPINGSNIEGLYMARILTLNPGVNGNIPGSATIQRQQDKFTAYVRLFGGAPNVWHQQNIFEGRRCPNASDDLNGDGFIDIQEGYRVWGRILIPLDSNLNSQNAGRNVYPVADSSGTYFYERVSSFKTMLEDLQSEDKNISDNYVKLDPSRGFDIEGRVVVIQGTSESVYFPATVASSDGLDPHQTLPIACGVFTKVNSMPAQPDISETPVPVEPPTPTPTPTPVPDYPRDDSETNGQDEEWYDRVVEWWRDRWDHSRRGRRTDWGNGLRMF